MTIWPVLVTMKLGQAHQKWYKSVLRLLLCSFYTSKNLVLEHVINSSYKMPFPPFHLQSMKHLCEVLFTWIILHWSAHIFNYSLLAWRQWENQVNTSDFWWEKIAVIYTFWLTCSTVLHIPTSFNIFYEKCTTSWKWHLLRLIFKWSWEFSQHHEWHNEYEDRKVHFSLSSSQYWVVQAGLLTPLTFAWHHLSPLATFTSGAYFLHNGRWWQWICKFNSANFKDIFGGP